MKKNTNILKLNRCREIIKKGNPISKEDTIFVCELLKNHKQYEKKIGKGISYLFIKKTYWGKKCFFIKRIDNSKTDFSFLKCFSEKTHIQKIKSACRFAISNDIISKSRRGYIAHHETPFIDIFNLWIKNKNINNFNIIEGKDNCDVITFKDTHVSADFRKFHNSMAIIKEVSIEEHKKIHEKKRK